MIGEVLEEVSYRALSPGRSRISCAREGHVHLSLSLPQGAWEAPQETREAPSGGEGEAPLSTQKGNACLSSEGHERCCMLMRGTEVPF